MQRLDGDDARDGGGAAGDGTAEVALATVAPGHDSRVLPYLNTMHYIVRVISYISPLNKHRLNI